MNEHKCNKCQIIKPLTSEFYKPEKRVQSGFDVTCKTCNSERTKEYRKNNRKKVLAKDAEYRNKPAARAYQKEQYLKNKEYRIEKSKIYYNKIKLTDEYKIKRKEQRK